MKQKTFVVFLSLLFYIPIHANFEFINQKDHGILSQKFLSEIANTFHPKIFFETGTYQAETTLAAIPFYKEIYTVELFDTLYKSCKEKLKNKENVHIFNERSPETISRIAPTLEGPIVFWLDAHYSGAGTALGYDNPSDPESVTAIRAELKAIAESNIQNCTILIDDIRGFGIQISGTEYLGCWAYPTVQELYEMLLKINPMFEVILLGDILLAYDKTKYSPQFSETVLACSKTRFYDGNNLTDTQLIEQEKIIMHAPEHEKNYIRTLYNSITNYKDPMFWHDLWYGLVELGSKNYSNAYTAFSKVKLRTQCLNRKREVTNLNIPYNHWRIDWYIEQCKNNNFF
jgi:hypothetical protein